MPRGPVAYWMSAEPTAASSARRAAADRVVLELGCDAAEHSDAAGSLCSRAHA
jgi:hypothetical protein